MQNYADYANELVGRIDAGELEPSEVDIRPFVENESDVLTPDLRDRLEGTGKIQEYNLRVRERDHRDLQGEQIEKSDEARQTLDALRTAVDDGEPIEATVYLGEAPVTVTKRITGTLEQHIDAVAKEGESANPDFEAVKDHLVEAIFSLIIDDGEDDGYRFTDRVVWEEFYAERGSEALYDVFEIVSEPAIERRERLNKFRGQRDRR